jgi:hypothetical protein
MSDWLMILGFAVTTIGLLFAFHKWRVSRDDKRHEQHEQKFAQHFDIFSRHEGRIERNESEIRTTRDELHRDYVRGDQLDRVMGTIGEEFKEVHVRLGGIAKDLNQAIGSIRANQDADMKALVSEIKDAIKHGRD